MKINNLIYIVLLGIIVSLTSCEDDDSLFSGNENYITSFRLVQQGDSYAGIIKGDSLILSIPENLSLEGAIMEILCSENARISPDPGEVEDWGKLQNFTVTAYNNTQRVYKYIVRRTLTGSEGDVRLTSVEDLEAFAAQGINKVNGNLVIGKEEGTVKEDFFGSFGLTKRGCRNGDHKSDLCRNFICRFGKFGTGWRIGDGTCNTECNHWTSVDTGD